MQRQSLPSMQTRFERQYRYTLIYTHIRSYTMMRCFAGAWLKRKLPRQAASHFFLPFAVRDSAKVSKSNKTVMVKY